MLHGFSGFRQIPLPFHPLDPYQFSGVRSDQRSPALFLGQKLKHLETIPHLNGPV